MTFSDVRFDRNLVGVLFAFHVRRLPPSRGTIASKSLSFQHDTDEANRHRVRSGVDWIRVPSVRTSNTSIAHVITKLLTQLHRYSERSFIPPTRPRLSVFPVVLRGQRQRFSNASGRATYRVDIVITVVCAVLSGGNSSMYFSVPASEKARTTVAVRRTTTAGP